MEVDEDTSVGVVIANLKTGVAHDHRHADAALAVPARRAGVLRVRPVERAAAADGDQGARRDRVRVRAPGGPDVGRLRRRRPVHGPLQRPPADGACGSFVGCLGMGIAGVFYGLSPTIAIAIVWVIVSGLLQLAVVRRPPDAAPAQHAARAARPRVLGDVRHARRDLPRSAWRAPAWPTSSTCACCSSSSSLILVVGRRRRARRAGRRPAGRRVAARPVGPARDAGRRRPATARPATVSRLRPPRRRGWRRSACSTDSAAGRVHRRRHGPRGPRGRRASSRKGDKATCRLLHPRGRGRGRHPGGRRRLPRPVDDGRRRLLRRDRARSPGARARPTSSSPEPTTLLEVPGRGAARGHGGPGGQHAGARRR